MTMMMAVTMNSIRTRVSGRKASRGGFLAVMDFGSGCTMATKDSHVGLVQF